MNLAELIPVGLLILTGHDPDLQSSSGTTVCGSGDEDSDADSEEGKSGHRRSHQEEDGEGSEPKNMGIENTDLLSTEVDKTNHGDQCVAGADQAGATLHEETPTAEVVETKGNGEPTSDMEINVEQQIIVKGEGETKGKGMEVVESEGLHDEQEGVLNQESLEIWGRPWSSLVQTMAAVTETTNLDDCMELSIPSDGHRNRGENEVIPGVKRSEGDEVVEAPVVGKQVKGKRKSEEGRRLQEELEGQRMAGRLSVADTGPAQRTRASRRSLGGEDDGTEAVGEGEGQRRAKNRKPKKREVEKLASKSGGKRKSKESPSLRSGPNFASPVDSPSGKKLKPVKSVLEASN